jgi:diguanylate cyclase (GGDEF)-like protein
MREHESALRRSIVGVIRWPVWSLPAFLRTYVLSVIVLWATAVVIALREFRLDAGHLALAGLLLGCGAASIEVARRFGEPVGVVWKDMQGVWTLPITLLLPPQYALLAPVPIHILSQLRVHRSLVHRVVFSMAAVGLPSGLVSWAFHELAGAAPIRGSAAQAGTWLLVGVAAGAVRAFVNLFLVAVAVKASDPEARWRALLASREGSTLEAVQISAGVTIAGLCLVSPWLILLALPAMLFLLGRNAMSMQLKAVAHTDHKTGVLSAAGWEREAKVAIARAHRAQTPLAVLMLDLDEFKRVNDTQGHLGGDAVLRLVAEELRAHLRPDDLIGRFGGDEFAVLLPATEPDDAYDVAERLRKHIADTVVVPTNTGTLQVTVSVGLVTLPKPRFDVTDLLTAADHALYRSKQTGRNRTSRLAIGPDDPTP